MIYIEGRDDNGQPIIVINPSRINFKLDKKVEVYIIMCRCFIIVKEYMLNEGYINKWRIIIDGEYQMESQLQFGVHLFLFFFLCEHFHYVMFSSFSF